MRRPSTEQRAQVFSNLIQMAGVVVLGWNSLAEGLTSPRSVSRTVRTLWPQTSFAVVTMLGHTSA